MGKPRCVLQTVIEDRVCLGTGPLDIGDEWTTAVGAAPFVVPLEDYRAAAKTGQGRFLRSLLSGTARLVWMPRARAHPNQI